jgi:hypothetical protein
MSNTANETILGKRMIRTKKKKNSLGIEGGRLMSFFSFICWAGFFVMAIEKTKNTRVANRPKHE